MPFRLFVLWFVVLLDGVSVFWGPLPTKVPLGPDTLIVFKINIRGRRVPGSGSICWLWWEFSISPSYAPLVTSFCGHRSPATCSWPRSLCNVYLRAWTCPSARVTKKNCIFIALPPKGVSQHWSLQTPERPTSNLESAAEWNLESSFRRSHLYRGVGLLGLFPIFVLLLKKLHYDSYSLIFLPKQKVNEMDMGRQTVKQKANAFLCPSRLQRQQ